MTLVTQHFKFSFFYKYTFIFDFLLNNVQNCSPVGLPRLQKLWGWIGLPHQKHVGLYQTTSSNRALCTSAESNSLATGATLCSVTHYVWYLHLLHFSLLSKASSCKLYKTWTHHNTLPRDHRMILRGGAKVCAQGVSERDMPPSEVGQFWLLWTNKFCPLAHTFDESGLKIRLNACLYNMCYYNTLLFLLPPPMLPRAMLPYII